MHRVLKKHGWSSDPKKSKWGSIKRAAEELGWSRPTLNKYIKKYPSPPEPPWQQRVARMILDYYYEMRDRIGDFWHWKASWLLPFRMGTYEEEENFFEHQRNRERLDFSILDDIFDEFSKLKLVWYGWRSMVITKGEVKVTDLREPPWRGTTILDKIRYEIHGELPQQKSKQT